MTPGTIWLPYCGAAPTPGEWLGRWNFDPVLLAVLAAATLAYLRLDPKGAGRHCFFGGMAVLLLLFVSPFCALTSALFSARVAHHVLLTAAAAPLLVLALPVRRVPGGVAVWASLHAALFWIWHAPPVYEAALSHDLIYWTMQASLLGSAWAMWMALRGASMPAAMAGLLGTTVQMGLLGALLTFAPAALYAPHAVAPLAWGLTPLEDQQLAGLIMWVPAAGIYLAAALALAGRWLAREQRAAAAR